MSLRTSRKEARSTAAKRAAVTGAMLLVFATATRPAFADGGARIVNNWNQWDDDARGGVVEGMTRLGVGADYGAVVSGSHTVRLAAEVEHLLGDHWGVTGALALPVGGEWIAPATLGLRLHLVPKFPLDPFVSVAGGAAWLAPDGLAAVAAPFASARAGLALHYFGLFFVQVEGGYEAAQYGREGVTLDLGTVVFAGRLGVDL